MSRYEADSVSVSWTVRPFVNKAAPQRVVVVGDELDRVNRAASTVRELTQLREDLSAALSVGESLRDELRELRLAMKLLTNRVGE